MVASVLSMRNLPGPIMPRLGRVMLASYFEANPDPGVRARVLRLSRFSCAAACARCGPCRDGCVRATSRDFRVADTLRPMNEPMNAATDTSLDYLRVPPHSIEAEQSVLGGCCWIMPPGTASPTYWSKRLLPA